MTHTDPIKALVEHMERHIEQYYGTEHTPIFNWTEWEIILAALKPASPAPVDGERVERVARAIYEAEPGGNWELLNVRGLERWKKLARAALAAINGEK